MFLFWLAVAVFLIYLLRKWFDSVFDDTVGDPVEVTSNSNSTRLNDVKDYSPVDANVVRLAEIAIKISTSKGGLSDKYIVTFFNDGAVLFLWFGVAEFLEMMGEDYFCEWFGLNESDISFFARYGKVRDDNTFELYYTGSSGMNTLGYVKGFFEEASTKDKLTRNDVKISYSDRPTTDGYSREICFSLNHEGLKVWGT